MTKTDCIIFIDQIIDQMYIASCVGDFAEFQFLAIHVAICYHDMFNDDGRSGRLCCFVQSSWLYGGSSPDHDGTYSSVIVTDLRNMSLLSLHAQPIGLNGATDYRFYPKMIIFLDG